MAVQRLTPSELLGVRDVLRPAFSRSRFGEILMRLNRELDDLVAPVETYPEALLSVLVDANAQLWWRDLLRESRLALPTDAALQQLGEHYALSTPIVSSEGQVSGPQLEIKIKAAQSTYDIGPWRSRLGTIEGQVCRIEYPAGKAQGTGFLVGRDRVLTNFHVMDPIISGASSARKVVLRFDYLVDRDGITVHAGTAHELAAGDRTEWLIDSSPPSPLDRQTNPATDPAPDQLDYALLRLTRPAGQEPVGGATNDTRAPLRGWIDVPEEDYAFSRASGVYIVQHPDGLPMQVALDTEGVIGRNANGTRVRYTTTTLPGSSGSPCFSPDWDLVALHHSGDPQYNTIGVGSYNQGIPITAIRALLTKRNLAGALGDGSL